MTDKLPPTGVPFVDALRTVWRVWGVVSPSVPSKITAADREALDAAGWRVIPGKVQVWIRPDGKRVSINEANSAAAILRTPGIAPAPAPRPQLPTGGEILDDLLKRPRHAPPPSPPSELERLLRRGPQTDFERLMDKTFRPGSAADVAGRVLPTIARAAGLFVMGLLYPSSIGVEAPVRDRRRPRRLRRRAAAPAVPRVPGLPPQAPRSRPRMPQGSPDPAPLPTRTPPIPDTAVLYRPTTSPLPAPSSLPRPYALPSAPGLRFPAPLLAPLALLIPSSSPSPRVYVNPMTDSPEFTNIPSPAIAPLTSVRTAPLGSVPPGDPCSCTRSAPRKRKRCSNPIVSKRTRTESNRKFLTITRELKCP